MTSIASVLAPRRRQRVASGRRSRCETETFGPHGHGGGGFTVEYTRRVYRDERLLRNERYRVS